MRTDMPSRRLGMRTLGTKRSIARTFLGLVAAALTLGVALLPAACSPQDPCTLCNKKSQYCLVMVSVRM